MSPERHFGNCRTAKLALITLYLPSGSSLSLGLAHYRYIYRSYRADPDLQRVLERHTFIFTHHDHETANDCYWDYGRDTLGAPDHLQG